MLSARLQRCCGFVLAVLLAVPVSMLSFSPAEAVVFDPLTLKSTTRVNGDFVQVGNGILKCPGNTTGCNSLHSGSTDSATANDNFAMNWADTDSNPTTFNSSSATVTVPAGATVAYAKLFWSASTGRFRSGRTTTGLSCSNTANNSVVLPTAGSKDTVSLTATGVTQNVTGRVIDETANQFSSNQSLSYSATAVVTDQLRSLPSGSSQTITVGNLWGAQGKNCHGGWGIDLVYDFGTYVPGEPRSTLKEVYQFDGHIRQFEGDPAQTVTLTGLNPQGVGAKVGFIAHEGDRSISGDVATYSDPSTTAKPLTSPYGDTNNKWVSIADGSVAYAPFTGRFNNANVDVYTQDLADLDSGDSSFSVKLATTQDSYLLQNVITAVPLAGVEIVKTAQSDDDDQVLLPGGQPGYRLTVYNTGGVNLTDLRVADALAPSCNKTIGNLAGGASNTYTCTGPSTNDSLVNKAIVRARTAAGQDVENEDTTKVSIAKIKITKTAKQPDVPKGTPATWVITVTNNGGAALRDVAVADPSVSGCARTFATLAVGQTRTYECPSGNLSAGVSNTADVTALAGTPNQTAVTVTDTATATVAVSDIALTKTAAPVLVEPGQNATFTFTVRNTGETTLNTVAIDDPAFPACNRTDLGPLAAGATRTVTCVAPIAEAVTNTATATGTPPSGTKVNATANVKVDTMAISLKKTAATTDTNSNGDLDAGDVVRYSFKVTNTGSTSVNTVAITDPKVSGLTCPSTTLAAGASTTCTANPYTVTAADVQAGTLRNDATATARSTDNTTLTAKDSVTLTPVQRSAIALTKTATPTTVDAVGQQVSYAFKATNTGNVTLTGVTISDPLPGLSGLACTPAAGSPLAPGASMNCTATRITTQADLTAGSVQNTATVRATDAQNKTLTETAKATVQATQRAALALTKVASPNTFSLPGQVITYTMTATNTGNVPLTGVSISDTKLPSLTCTQPVTLAPGATLQCTGSFTTTQAQVDSGAILNTASVTGRGPQNQQSTTTAQAVVTPVSTPSIDVTKTASRSTVTAVGQTVTYTLVATNTGNQTLTGVTLSDPLAGLSPLSCTAPGQGGSLAPLGTLRCTATYVTAQADLDRGVINNTAAVTGRGPNNQTVTDTGPATVTATQTPVIGLTKTATPATATRAGDATAYRFVISNPGNVTLSGIGLSDPIPGLGAITCAPTALGGSLAPGGSTTCDASRAITQADVNNGGVTNVATANGASPAGVRVQDTANAPVTIAPAPSLSLQKSASPLTVDSAGETITYSFTVVNTGNVTLSGVALTDDLVSGLSCLTGASGSLAPGASLVCSGTRAVTQADIDAGAVINTATVRGEAPGGDPGGTNDDVTATDSETVTSSRAPSIDIEKATTATTFTTAGEQIPYTFAVRNTGNVTLTGVTVSDPVPGLSAIACTPTLPRTLEPGASTLCSANLTVTQAQVDAGTIVNTATATGSAPGGASITDESTKTLNGTASPALTLEKTVSPTAVAAVGEQTTYTFVITNTGNQTLSGVGLTDDLSGLGALNCGPALGTNLAPGGSLTCTAERDITQSDLDAGSVLNSATATATAPEDRTLSVTDPAAVTVTQQPRLTLTKTASPSTVTAAGDNVTYTVVVRNTGNVSATNLAITDPLLGADGLACEPVDTSRLAPQSDITCTGTRAVSQAEFDSGSLTNTATVNATGPDGATAIPPVSDTATVTATRTPALTLAKSVTPTQANADTGTLNYTFDVFNSGNVTVDNVQLTDPLPGLGALSCIPALGSSLAPGASLQCLASKPLTQSDIDAGSVLNLATATGDGPAGTTVRDATDDALVTIAQQPGISLTKTATPATVTAVGDVVTYDFVVTNTGDVSLSGVTVVDGLAGLGAVTCADPSSTLLPGASRACSAQRLTTQDDLDAGSVTNTATVSAELPKGDPNDPADDVTDDDAAVVTATQQPGLSLAKTADVSSVDAAGDTIGYTFVITNNGNTTLSDVQLVDGLPGLGDLTCAPTLGSALAPGVAITCTADYSVTQADLDAGGVSNDASASAAPPTGPRVTADASADVTANRNGSIELIKSAAPSTVDAPGDVVTYTFVVRNTGNVTLSDVAPSDDLVGLSALDCTPASASSLAPGGTLTCTATRATTQADLDRGRIPNTGVVTANDPAGNAVTDDSTVTVQVTQDPQLSFTKTANPSTYDSVGDKITYTLTTKNTGNVTVGDIVVNDALPGLLDLACDANGPFSLAPGASNTCTATRDITQSDLDNGSLVNAASVTGTGPNGQPLPVLTAKAPVTAEQNPAVALTKTANPKTVDTLGQVVTYTITATNTGNVTLTGVTTTDPLTGLSALDCVEDDTLAPGDSRTCTATRATTQADLDAGGVDNTATVTAEGAGGDPTDDGDNVTATAKERVEATRNPALSLDKTVDPLTFTAAGQTARYTFVAENTGNVSITDVGLTDPLTGLGDLTCAPALGGTLAPGGTIVCTADYTFTQADVDAGSVTNTATLSGKDPQDKAIEATDGAVSQAEPAPALDLVKTADQGTYDAVGDVITYTFTATNNGNQTLTGVAVTDPLPRLGAISCDVAAPISLAPGESSVCKATYTIDQANLDTGSIVNTATVTGQPPVGDPVGDTATTTVTAVADPSLKITKTASVASFDAVGAPIAFTVLVENTGNVTLNNLVVTDPLPGVTLNACDTTTLAPGQSATCSADYATTQADLDNGGLRNDASATADAPVGTASDATFVDVPAVQSPSLTLTKTADADAVSAVGEQIVYTLTATNTGNVSIVGAQITDEMVQNDPLQSFSCDPVGTPTVAPQGAIACTGTHTVTQADLDRGSILNTASVAGQTPQGAPVEPVRTTETVDVDQRPALTATKTADRATYSAVDQEINYTITITNTGNVGLDDVAVSDPLLGDALTCTPAIGTRLAAGASLACSGSHAITQADLDAGSLTNVVEATGTPPAGLDAPTATANVTVNAEGAPSLSAVKTADAASVNAVGQRIEFSVLVTNTGNQTLTGVNVSDPLLGPAPLACPAAAASLAPGADVTCTGSYLVTQADLDRGVIENTATATATAPAGTVVTADGATSVPVLQAPELSIEKTASPASPASVSAVGDPTSYAFTITNTGNVSIADVSLSDPIDGLSAPSCTPALGTTLLPGNAITCTATRAVTQEDLNRGVIDNTATAAGLAPNGTAVPPASDAAQIRVAQSPELTLDKTVSPDTVDGVGDVVTYTFVASNTGNVSLDRVTVTDSLPGLTDFTCNPANGGSLNPGESRTCTASLAIDQTALDAGSILNTATVTSDRQDGSEGPSDDDPAVVTAEQSTGLSLTKTADAPRVQATGDTITYTFVVTNEGTITANDVQIADPMTGLSALDCAPALGSSLAPGASLTCTATLQTTQAQMDQPQLVNSATATATAANGEALTATDSATVIPVHQPALSLVKTADPETFSPVGQVIDYRFEIANTGNALVNDVRLIDPLPGLGALDCTPAQGSTLDIGETMACTASYTITQADLDRGEVANTANVTASDPNGDPVELPTDDATTTAEQAPQLSLGKTSATELVIAVGQPITFDFRIANEGNLTVNNVTLSDLSPGVSDPVCTTPNGSVSLAPGGVLECTATYVATQADFDAGRVLNNATVTGTRPDGTALTPGESGNATLTIPTDSGSALSIDKTADVASVSVIGDQVNYTITTTNTGNVTLLDVNPVDTLEGLTALTCDQPRPATLAPNASITCRASYAFTAADFDRGSLLNTATATARTNLGDQLRKTDDVTVTAEQAPELTLTKTADLQQVSVAGQVITYSFLATNTGNVTINDVDLTDPLDGLGALDCSTDLPTDLGVGELVRCTASYTVTQADINTGSIVNTATITGDPVGGDLAPVTATEVVTAQQAPQLDLIKTADVDSVDAVGEPIGYTFEITNNGNVSIDNVQLTDSLPGLGAITCTPALGSTLQPGDTAVCNAGYATTHEDLENGQIRNAATATGNAAGVAVTDDAAVVVPAIYAPSLSLEKSVTGPENWVAGDTLTYSFEVTNTGTIAATNLAVTDELPGLSSVACPPGILEPGAATTCTASYTVTQNDVNIGSIVNTATVNAVEVTGQAFPPASGSATTTSENAGAISLTKAADRTEYAAVGDQITYTFTVTNVSQISVAGVAVVDELDGLSDLACPADDGLDPGESLSCTAIYTITQNDLDTGSVLNTATGDAQDARGRTLPQASDSETVFATQTPGLALTKVADVASVEAVGDPIVYTFTLTNTGNVTISDATVVDEVDGVTLTDCGPLTLGAGETVTCTGTYAATQADLDSGSVENSAVLSGASPSGPVESAPATSSVPVDARPSITLVKTAGTDEIVDPGEVVEYTFVATNTGNLTLSGVTITDPLEGLSALDCGPAAPLAPGASLTCTASLTVTQAQFDGDQVTNTASVTATAPGDDPATPADDVTDSDTLDIDTRHRPAVELTKVADRASVTSVGELITYTFTVTNTGNSTIGTVAITDPKPGMSSVVCDTQRLAPGEVSTCASSYPVSQADLDKGEIVNSATVNATDVNNEPAPEASATEIVDVDQSPSLSVEKRADRTSVAQVGEEIRYTFLVTNTGNVSASGVEVSDPLEGLGELECAPKLPATLAPGATSVCAATYTVTQQDLNSGAILNTARVSGNGPQGDPITPGTSSEVVEVDADRAMTLIKTADVDSVDAAGDVIVYTLTGANTGNQSISEMFIADTLEGLSDLACTPAQGSTVAPTESLVCRASYTVTQADIDRGSVANLATLTGNGPDGNPIDPVSASTNTPVVQAPALEITKAVSRTEVGIAGAALRYTFTVVNTGNVTATDVQITDPLPGLGVIECGTDEAVSLAPGERVECGADYTVTQVDIDRGSIANVAVVTGNQTGGEPIPADSDSAEVTVTAGPAIALTKTADRSEITAAGQTIRYTFEARNTGNQTLTGVAISDELAGLGPVVCDDENVLASMAPNDTAICSAEYTVTQDDVDRGEVVNAALVAGEAPGGMVENPDDDVVATSSVTVPSVRNGGISLDKSADVDELGPLGQEIGYTFVITNTGNVTLSDVAVTDELPGLSEIACETTGALAPGEARTCTASYTVTQDDIDAGSVLNTASAVAEVPDGVEPVEPATDSVTLAGEVEIGVELLKTATVIDENDNGKNDPGEPIEYLIVASNIGAVTLTGVTIADPLPGLSSLTCDTEQPLRIAPGDSVFCTASYTITDADQQRGEVLNVATLTGDELPALQASVSVPVDAKAPPSGTATPTTEPSVQPPGGDDGPDSGPLADTGSPVGIGLVALLALLLLGGGATLLVLRRRRLKD